MSFKVTRKAVADREEAAQANRINAEEAPEAVTGQPAKLEPSEPLVDVRSSGSTLEQGPDALEEMRRERRRIAQTPPAMD